MKNTAVVGGDGDGEEEEEEEIERRKHGGVVVEKEGV